MEHKIKIEHEITVTNQDIDDIVAIALEGGITYWCIEAEVVGGEYYGEYASDQISRGGTLRLYDAEDEEGPWDLDLEKLLNGLKLYIEQEEDSGSIYDGAGLDVFQIDACIADCIIQYAIFGEVVFG